VADPPLYKRDPEAYRQHLAEGNAKQARKRVSADLLIRDSAGRILVVEPTYKPGWDMPGGMAEDNEAPHEAARRELAEELGVNVAVGQLLVVDWVSPHGPWDDLLAFVFDGGVLDDAAAGRLRPADRELATAEFVAPAEAIGRLRSRAASRARVALDALGDGRPRYLIDGHPAGE
jgi:8-oxo-dGTP pyrophosphatase MutT (NUDIX family)